MQNPAIMCSAPPLSEFGSALSTKVDAIPESREKEEISNFPSAGAVIAELR